MAANDPDANDKNELPDELEPSASEPGGNDFELVDMAELAGEFPDDGASNGQRAPSELPAVSDAGNQAAHESDSAEVPETGSLESAMGNAGAIDANPFREAPTAELLVTLPEGGNPADFISPSDPGGAKLRQWPFVPAEPSLSALAREEQALDFAPAISPSSDSGVGEPMPADETEPTGMLHRLPYVPGRDGGNAVKDLLIRHGDAPPRLENLAAAKDDSSERRPAVPPEQPSVGERNLASVEPPPPLPRVLVLVSLAEADKFVHEEIEHMSREVSRLARDIARDEIQAELFPIEARWRALLR